MATHSNIEKLTAVLVTWVKPMFDSVMANRLNGIQPVQAANEWVKKYFPVASNYSIVNDLSFLVVPASEVIIEPAVRNALAKAGVQDSEIPNYANKVVSSMVSEVESKGTITLFEFVELERDDVYRLRDLLRKNLPVEEYAKYEVIE